jgi:hypothetical protein
VSKYRQGPNIFDNAIPLWVGELQSRDSDDKDNSIDNGKEVEPEQESLISALPKDVQGESSGTSSCYHGTDDSSGHYVFICRPTMKGVIADKS